MQAAFSTLLRPKVDPYKLYMNKTTSTRRCFIPAVAAGMNMSYSCLHSTKRLALCLCKVGYGADPCPAFDSVCLYIYIYIYIYI